MTSDVEPRSSVLDNLLAGRFSPRLLAALVAGAIVLIGTPILVLLLHTTPPPPDAKGKLEKGDTVQEVRDALANETDVITLKNSGQQLNAHFRQIDKRPPTLDAKQREALQTLVKLDADELTEIDSSAFTTLDAHYLDSCFLLRDAARALQVDATGATAEDAFLRLRQATAAFQWVVRQVRLEQTAGANFPPQFALRRGRGTALERSLIFLELLRQFNWGSEPATALTGCLFVDPTVVSGQQRIWAVGVVIGSNVYLFDPNLGLPIPGAEGKGVATLADALKDAKILGQLTVNDKYPYDVTADKLRTSDAQLCVSLSALAPRLALLENDVFGNHLRVKVAADLVNEEKAVQTALKSAGLDTAKVGESPLALRLLRTFLPVDEGGADSKTFHMPLGYLPGFAAAQDNNLVVDMYRKTYFDTELIPWSGLPEEFRQFPPNAGLGNYIRVHYAQPFSQSALDPKGARDLLLRGRYSQVIKDLVEERDPLTEDYRSWQKEIKASGGEKAFSLKVRMFLAGKMMEASADLERKKREDPSAAAAAQQELLKLWNAGTEANALLKGSIAAQRRPEITYLLALAKQEQAEQLQQRLPASGPASPGEAAALAAAWKGAEEWWRHYAEEYPNGPAIAAIRRPRGRCHAQTGNWDAAVAVWEDVSDPIAASPLERVQPLSPLEKVGNLYLADQLRKQHPTGAKP